MTNNRFIKKIDKMKEESITEIYVDKLPRCCGVCKFRQLMDNLHGGVNAYVCRAVDILIGNNCIFNEKNTEIYFKRLKCCPLKEIENKK